MTIRGHLAPCGVVWSGEFTLVAAKSGVCRRNYRRGFGLTTCGVCNGEVARGVVLERRQVALGMAGASRMHPASMALCMAVAARKAACRLCIHLSMSYRDGQVSRSDPSTGSFPVHVLYCILPWAGGTDDEEHTSLVYRAGVAPEDPDHRKSTRKLAAGLNKTGRWED